MSLLIIGSCSRITSKIVQSLARNQQYTRITIGDLLPTYNFHNRYYRLRKELDQEKLSVNVELQKLFETNQIPVLSEEHGDVLFVTHDYYATVSSKLKLMEVTANANKKREHLFFATPVEYDQFGYQNPEQRYQEAENKVREINPNSTIIRSDVQDHGESVAYINHDKNILDDRLFEFSYSQKFSPRIVSSAHYANVVANAMKDRLQGKRLCLLGKEEQNAKEVDFDRSIDKEEICHIKGNVRNMMSKYSGLLGDGYEQVAAEASQ